MKKITQLPQPPNSKDSVNFNDRADKFVASLPRFVDEINEYALEAEELFSTAIYEAKDRLARELNAEQFKNMFAMASDQIIKVANVEADGVIDISKGDYFRLNMTRATTLSLINEPKVSKKPIYAFILEVINGDKYALTWFDGVSWGKSIAPDFTANKRNIFSFIVTENNIVGISLAKELTTPSRQRVEVENAAN